MKEKTLYWEEVLKRLIENKNIKITKAKKGISEYKKILKKYKIGEIIYHEDIDDTVEAVLNNMPNDEKS